MATERNKRAGTDSPPASPLRRIQFVGLFVIVPVLLLLLENYTDIDLRLADIYFDPVRRVFPLEHAWLTEIFGHLFLRRVLIGLGASVVLLCIWDAVRPLRRLNALRRMQLRTLAISAALVPATVSALKHFSATHCPWDLQRYGGTEPYVRLLDAVPASMHPGNCFPGGHASGALWLVALAVFWLPHRPRMAALAGAAMLSFGFAVGWLQQARGAHFLSHTLWSMWIACAIVVLLSRGMMCFSAAH